MLFYFFKQQHLVKLVLPYGEVFQGFLDRSTLKCIIISPLLGVPWDSASCPSLHRLDLLPESRMEK